MKIFYKICLLLPLFISLGCHQNTSHNQSAKASSETALQRLLNGNYRFSHLKPTHPDEAIEQLKDAAIGQHPFAVIVCCSDSRVSPELIFDQGIGDLFVIRTAGNIIGALEIGSIEYAIEHLGAKLIIVMGHENCGAVKAFIEGGETPGHIKDIIDSIRQEAEVKAIPISDTNRLDHCVKANVLHGLKQLKTESKILSEKVAKGEINIVGARYDLDGFKVTILKQ